jgi:arylsulfatase A-like enzyme
VGLSATDFIGHEFGPDSHEMRDNLLRLDLALGAFIADLESMVGRGNILIALSADHAVMPLPEYLSTVLFKPAQRVDPKTKVTPALDSLNEVLKRKFKSNEAVVRKEGFLNYSTAKKAGVSAPALEKQVRDALMKTGVVADVFFKTELTAKRSKERPYTQQFRNSLYAPRSRDFQILYKEFTLITSKNTGTSHGTPYEYDTHVPLLFWGKKFTTNRSETLVHSIDVAPTLARMIGIPIPKTVDGVPIADALK